MLLRARRSITLPWLLTAGHPDIQLDRHADIQTNRHTHGHTDTQYYRNTDNETDRHTDIQTDIVVTALMLLINKLNNFSNVSIIVFIKLFTQRCTQKDHSLYTNDTTRKSSTWRNDQ